MVIKFVFRLGTKHLFSRLNLFLKFLCTTFHRSISPSFFRTISSDFHRLVVQTIRVTVYMSLMFKSG